MRNTKIFPLITIRRLVIFNVLLPLFYLLSLSLSVADNYVDLKIEPADVGVFFVNKSEQFTAFGKTSSGKWVDITTEVDWYVEDFPFIGQTMPVSQVVKIDKNGLATVLSTWGRVKVSACYPKGCHEPVIPPWGAAVNFLLLKRKKVEFYLQYTDCCLIRTNNLVSAKLVWDKKHVNFN